MLGGLVELFEAFDDVDISHHCLDDDERYFARIIGCIEDVLMDEGFITLHQDFMENHWHQFDENDENKLIYTDIFKKYIEIVEKHIENELKEAIPGFNMLDFEIELSKRRNDLDGEIFEVLTTFTDFISFKEKFLDYKAMKEGKTVDFSKDLSVMQFTTENL